MKTSTATPSERFLRRARRRVRDAAGQVRGAYLRSLRNVSDALPEREIEEMIAKGAAMASILILIDRVLPFAVVPLRASAQQAVTRAVTLFARDIPGAQRSAYVVSLLSAGPLNPRVQEAIRTVDSVVTNRFADSVRGTVRAVVERGYASGQGPRTTARELRSLIGLSEAELKQVANFRDALTGANGRRWEDYARRDRRFDGTIRKAMESGKGLKPEQVERMTATYAKRRLALSAEANARTATLDAYKQAQRVAWQVAVDSGQVDGARLVKEWIGVDDGRERPSHVEMNGEVVPYDATFSNGDDLPGDNDPWGCRCFPRYFETREQRA